MQGLRKQIVMVVALAALLGGSGSLAQSAPGNDPGPSQTGAVGQVASRPGAGGNGAAASGGGDAGVASAVGLGAGPDSALGAANNPGVALTARQIFAVLEEKPEVVIELKTQVADQMQQQGVSIDANAITDEMLDNEIATDPAVRQKVTLFLRARGYVSDADIAASRTAAGLSADEGMPGYASGSLTTLPGTDAGAANLPLPFGPARTAGEDAKAATGKMPSGAGSAQLKPRERNITDPPEVLREPTPYNLPSLRDLYTQIPNTSQPLRRFGSDVFVRRSAGSAARLGGSTSVPSLDVPIGPDYVLGPGDSLRIDLWGGLSLSFTRVVDRDGQLMLPEAGEVQVAGLTLDRARATIGQALGKQYRNAQVSVTVAGLRSVRVYVVGDVESPGAYDVSSLATPLSALYAAGGPTAAGSLRLLEHYRGRQRVGEVDLYDFFLHGVRSEDDRLEAGDTLLLPPAGPQVAVSGAVRRPAIYELKDEQTLEQVLDDAGGATVAAALGNITVERIDAHRQRETLNVDVSPGDDKQATQAKLAAFAVKDGDRVRVAPIAPWSAQVVYLEGHVVRPGRAAYRDGMRLSDVLHSYRDLLPEPADRGEIVRLTPPDLHPEAIEFSVAEALIGNENLPLEPFDTIRIFGRYESDAPRVTVNGEVLRPGEYPLSEGMTAAQLVRMAGGFRRDALLDDADLMSYRMENGTRVVGERRDVKIGDALKGVANEDVVLKAGDVLTVHQVTGWNDIGESVTIEGEVAYPGNYGFKDGEHLSDVLRRAGGFRETAYAEGAVLTRPEVKDLEEKSRAELIRQIETSSAATRLSPSLAGGSQTGTVQMIQAQEQQIVARLRSEPAIGRLVIHISADINSWAGTPADIEVRRGDVLRVPKRPGFVLVSGQVFNATAITFSPNRTAGWYLSRVGGTTRAADRKQIFVIRANGSVVGRGSGGAFGGGVLDTKLEPGDVVVVPQKLIGSGLFWRNLLLGTQAASSIALTAGIANVL